MDIVRFANPKLLWLLTLVVPMTAYYVYRLHAFHCAAPSFSTERLNEHSLLEHFIKSPLFKCFSTVYAPHTGHFSSATGSKDVNEHSG